MTIERNASEFTVMGTSTKAHKSSIYIGHYYLIELASRLDKYVVD